MTRNSLTYTAPFMLNDAVLGLTLTQIGGLTSILPIAYGAPTPLRITHNAGLCSHATLGMQRVGKLGVLEK